MRIGEPYEYRQFSKVCRGFGLFMVRQCVTSRKYGETLALATLQPRFG
jgi:hypothetical protein